MSAGDSQRYLVFYDREDDVWRARAATPAEAEESDEDVFDSLEDATTEAGIRTVSYPPPNE